MSNRDYIAVPGYSRLRLCVRSFAPHSSTIGLCYTGPTLELIMAGVATLEMLTTDKSGFDAAGDHYTTDAHWQQRYRIWRKMKRTRALSMPGVHEALAHTAAQMRHTRDRGLAPQQRHQQRQR